MINKQQKERICNGSVKCIASTQTHTHTHTEAHACLQKQIHVCMHTHTLAHLTTQIPTHNRLFRITIYSVEQTCIVIFSFANRTVCQTTLFTTQHKPCKRTAPGGEKRANTYSVVLQIRLKSNISGVKTADWLQKKVLIHNYLESHTERT